jgi:ADP-ribose pyrophosphatase
VRVDRYAFRHVSLNGGWAEPERREVVERGHAVGVIPYDARRDRLVLVAQFSIGAFAAGRFPFMEEIVAGLVDEGERPEATARRECEEECGCAPQALVPAVTFQSSAGILSETVRIYCVAVESSEAKERGGAPGEAEDIRVLVLPWARIADASPPASIRARRPSSACTGLRSIATGCGAIGPAPDETIRGCASFPRRGVNLGGVRCGRS